MGKRNLQRKLSLVELPPFPVAGAAALPQNLEQVRALYNYRSRYVHEGIGILPVEIDKIEPIINCVLLCLFKLQANPDNRHAGAFERWLKSLDFIAAAMDAGKAVEAVDLLGCAIDQKVDNT